MFVFIMPTARQRGLEVLGTGCVARRSPTRRRRRIRVPLAERPRPRLVHALWVLSAYVVCLWLLFKTCCYLLCAYDCYCYYYYH